MIRVNEITKDELSSFIFENQYLFGENFRFLINKTDYAQKLIDNATIFTIKINGTIASIICAYINVEMNFTYIPYVCTSSNFQKKGLSQQLFNYIIKYSKDKGSLNIKLEVVRDNVRAINLYTKLGFKKYDESSTKLMMSYDIK